MEKEPSHNSVVEQSPRFEFFRRWGEYDARAVALLATLNGMSVSGFISAVQDFAQGEIGLGIVKTIATAVIPVSSSFLTGIVMLECAQVANPSNSSDNMNS